MANMILNLSEPKGDDKDVLKSCMAIIGNMA